MNGSFRRGRSWRARRWWRATVGPVWASVRPLVVLTLAASVIVLGTIGFQDGPGDPDLLDSLYRAIQLFGFGGGVPPSPPLTLQIARFLGPAIVGYAAIRGLLALSREQLQLLGFRLFLRDHVIVAGLGDIGFRLAVSFHEAGARVVAVERDPANPATTGCRERGIGVLVGDAADPSLLGKLRMVRARYLVIACGEDRANVEVAAAARSVVAPRRRGVLTAFMHLDDRALWRMMKAQALSSPSESPFRLELFNVFDTAARILVERYPPIDPGRAAQSAPRPLIVGEGAIAESLVLHVLRAARSLRQGEASDPGTIPLTLAGPAVAALSQSLLERHPEITTICELRTVSADLESAKLGDAASRDSTVAYVALLDEPRGLATALALRARLGHETPVVLAVADEGAGIAKALPQDADDPSGIHIFGIFSRALAPEVLLHGMTEVLARDRHDGYVRAEIAKGATRSDSPALVPWEELPDSLKDSNRRFADGIGAKLAAIGCIAVPAPLASESDHEFEFSPEELERLAEMEHQRWVEDLVRDGWLPTDGPKDPGLKRHPLLKGWDLLPEVEREKDRDAVRDLPAMLNRVGYQIYRAEAPSAREAP